MSLFYPCTTHPVTGRISVRQSRKPMSRDEAEDLLKRRFWQQWLRCEAIPQPENHPYFSKEPA